MSDYSLDGFNFAVVFKERGMDEVGVVVTRGSGDIMRVIQELPPEAEYRVYRQTDHPSLYGRVKEAE